MYCLIGLFYSTDWVDLCAIIVSVCALFVSVYSAHLQRKHNRLSVMPLISLFTMDYDNEIGFQIQNRGTGPLIIKRLEFTDDMGRKADNLIDLMPTEIIWTNYLTDLENVAIPANDHLTILVLKSNDAFECSCAREALRKIEVYIEFLDIYENFNSSSKDFKDSYN